MLTAAIALAVVLTASLAAAQAPGTAAVQVVDPSGAGIPHALVVLKNATRAIESTADLTGLV